jgi:LacI family transcriptional regulator
MAGLVLTPPLSEMPELLSALDENNICYVKIISGNGSDDERTICIDDFKAAADLTQYLIDLGHKDIAFLQGDKSHGSAQQRFSGYLSKLKENKICPNEDFIFEGLFSFESGVEGAFELLTRDKKPTAIFACNDEIAAGCLFTAGFMSIPVPKQLSIVGFEDSPFSRQALPQLTTAKQSNEDIAVAATQLLIPLIRKNTKPKSRVFTPELILRDSTCPIE